MTLNVVRLPEIVLELESGGRPEGGRTGRTGGVLSIGGEHIRSDGTISLENARYVPPQYYAKMRRGRVEIDDILVVKDGATTGKVAHVDSNLRLPAVVNEHVFRLSVDRSKVWPRYLFYHLFSPTGKLQILQDFRGATVGGISREFVDCVTLMLPDLGEQRRISQLLDQASRVRRIRRYALELSESLLKAVFVDLFGDPITNSGGWDRATISDLGVVQTGNTPSRANENYYGDAIEWIKSDNIAPTHMHPERAEEGLSEEGARVGRVVGPGALLVTCIAGSATSIGNVVLTDRRVAYNQQISAVIPREGVDPRFLYGLFLVIKPVIQENTTLAMKRMITKERLEGLAAIRPPMQTQLRFAAVVEAYRRLRIGSSEALRQADHLFNTVLDHTFSRRIGQPASLAPDTGETKEYLRRLT